MNTLWSRRHPPRSDPGRLLVIKSFFADTTKASSWRRERGWGKQLWKLCPAPSKGDVLSTLTSFTSYLFSPPSTHMFTPFPSFRCGCSRPWSISGSLLQFLLLPSSFLCSPSAIAPKSFLFLNPHLSHFFHFYHLFLGFSTKAPSPHG